ncbi:MAG: serine/threonine-protein kinase [Bryobacteraceae bacterium]
MSADRWLRMQELFHAASELTGPARAAYLDQWCPDDPVLRQEVEALLTSDEDEDLVEKSVRQAASQVLEERDDATQERLGPFRILRKLASGGMGSVFLAARDDDQYHQQVAIKLIRYGLNREDILRRFRAERQILANLAHANIARLLDGGVTAEGLPYLVMEFVDGLTIDAYCRDKNLPIKSRLRLFLTVCEAVQSAHSSLVVHRDIKPANILVTADGVVKLLDFGIAKILHQGTQPEEPALTRATDRVMTPEYASPEQIRGEPVTTATDVYALGVLLYELLAGQRPFRLDNTSAAEAERIICESDPDKPSTAAGKLTTDGHTLSRQLSGDLDNIVRMAMRKEASRRYPSAGALAEDIRRYLDGFPVVAAPDSWGYRSGKFVRRHKAGVAMAALVALLIVGFAIGMGILATRAQRERDTAQQVSQFMMDLFSVADPERARGREVTAREVLDRSAAKLKELDKQPVIQARLLDQMGKIYENLGLYDQSASLLERAVAVRRKLPTPDEVALASSLKALAELRRRKTDYAAAEALARESLAIRTRLHGQRHFDVAESLNTLALTLDESGHPKDAEKYFRQLLEMRDILRVNDPNQHLETAVLSNLGGVLRTQQRYDEAEKYLRECIDIRRRTLKGDHPRLALVLAKLGAVLSDAGRYQEAEPLLREGLAMRQRVYGGAHPDIVGSFSSLAHALTGQGRLEEAEKLYRQALDMSLRMYGPDHRSVAIEDRNLAGILRTTHKDAEAERLLRDSLRITRKMPPGHPLLANALLSLGSLLIDTGRAREAEPLLREAAQIRRKHFPESSWMVATVDAELAGALIRQGRNAEGQPLLDQSLAILRSNRGPATAETRSAERFLLSQK